MTSSISNSDERAHLPPRRKSRWQVIRRLGWGLLIAAILLGVADYSIFRDPYTYDVGNKNGARGGFIGQFAHIDRAFKAVDPGAIEYAVFGDSQSIDAMRPDIMAAELGVPAERIFNFSVTGGKPTDNAYTFRKYAERLPNLKHVIYVVNDHQFNNFDVSADTKFKFHATLRDRLRALNTHNYGELLTGWALRSFGLRTEWTNLITRYREGKWPPQEDAMYPGGIEPLTWADPKTKTAEYANEVADRWFKDWQLEGAYTEAFEDLMQAMRDRDIEVTILQIPRTDWFEAAVAEKYKVDQEQYLARVQSIADAVGAEFAVVTSADANLTLDDFRDANHVKPTGAEKLSRYVAGSWWR